MKGDGDPAKGNEPPERHQEETLFRYILVWIPMLLIAIANGALRQATFGKVLPELRAHQLSTLLGSVLIGVFVWLVIRRWPPASGRNAVVIGLVWVALTIGFEFWMVLGFMNRTLGQALGDYHLFAGRLWVLFLAWLALAPWLFFKLQSAA